METDIVQNLKDAGCEDEIIQRFLTAVEQRKTEDGIRLLRRHRRSLLEKLHEWQKKIDCLDYLLYQLNEKM